MQRRTRARSCVRTIQLDKPLPEAHRVRHEARADDDDSGVRRVAHIAEEVATRERHVEVRTASHPLTPYLLLTFKDCSGLSTSMRVNKCRCI